MKATINLLDVALDQLRKKVQEIELTVSDDKIVSVAQEAFSSVEAGARILYLLEGIGVK